MNTRTKLLSALASTGILAAGWGAATADGQTFGAGEVAATGPSGAAGSITQRPSSRTDATGGGQGGTDATGGGQGGTDATGGGQGGTDATGGGRTETGATSAHRFGSVTVTVTLSDGRITALSEQVTSDGERRSERINNQAVPILKRALIGTDGTGVSTISGATYTTRAYLTSLQSALDKAAS